MFVATLLVLSPLAYGLARARNISSASFSMADGLLMGIVIVLMALATAFIAQVVIHLLGREARARRRR